MFWHDPIDSKVDGRVRRVFPQCDILVLIYSPEARVCIEAYCRVLPTSNWYGASTNSPTGLTERWNRKESWLFFQVLIVFVRVPVSVVLADERGPRASDDICEGRHAATARWCVCPDERHQQQRPGHVSAGFEEKERHGLSILVWFREVWWKMRGVCCAWVLTSYRAMYCFSVDEYLYYRSVFWCSAGVPVMNSARFLEPSVVFITPRLNSVGVLGGVFRTSCAI